MKISTKQLMQTALLLAICIASQFLKNLSVYLTGPVVNTTIIIAVLAVSLWSGLIISIIAPVTAFFISGSPLMAAIPLMFPAVRFPVKGRFHGDCDCAYSASFLWRRCSGASSKAGSPACGPGSRADYLFHYAADNGSYRKRPRLYHMDTSSKIFT